MSSRLTVDTTTLKVRDVFCLNSNADYIQPASIPVIGDFGKIQWLSSIEFLSTISVPVLSTTILDILASVRPGFSSMSTIFGSTTTSAFRSTVAGLGSSGYVSTATLNNAVTGLSYDSGYISTTTLYDCFTNLADMGRITGYIGPMVKFLSGVGSNLSNGYISTMNPGSYHIYKSTLAYPGSSIFQSMADGATLRTGLLNIGGYSNKLVNTSLMRIDVNANISMTYPTGSALMVAAGYYATFNANGTVINNSNAMLLYTTDGINWEPSASAQSVFKSITKVAYDSYMNRWSAVGSNNSDQVLGTSYDGITWFVKGVSQINPIRAITIRQGRIFPQLPLDKPLIFIGGTHSSGLDCLKYTDDYGATFYTAALPNPGGGLSSETIRTITYGGLTWIATGVNIIYYSTDNGQTWSFVPNSNYNGFASITEPRCSSYNGSVWVICDISKIIYSSDGLNWYLSNNTISATLSDIAWNGKLWVAVGQLVAVNEPCILTSPDGINWSRSTVPEEIINESLPCVSVTWNPGLSTWYTVTNQGYYIYILYSLDGISWSIQESNYFKANRAVITSIRSAVGLPNTSASLNTSFSTFLTNSANSNILGKPVSLRFNGTSGLMTNLSFMLSSNDLAPSGVYPNQLQLNHRMVNGAGSNVTLSVQIPQSGGVFVTLDNTD